METSPEFPTPSITVPPSRWAGVLAGDSVALSELAGSYWYCVYVWWRRSGIAAQDAALATMASFTFWSSRRLPAMEDSGAELMRTWLPARLEELSGTDLELAGEPMITVEEKWAEQHYEDEPEGEPAALFHRRWALTVLEFSMQALRAEYADRGLDTLFREVAPFVGFESADEAHYTEAAERLGMTIGAVHKAVFDLRTHHRDLLRSVVADTVAELASVDSEITALLCTCDLPSAAGRAPASLPTAIRSFKPEELLARAINTVQMTRGGLGKWQPPSDAEIVRLFPQYEMCGLIGRGAMGAVYRARQVALDREVAVKLLPLEVSADQAFADRFVREARAMAKLSHPNIISVFNFGTTSEGHLFFVMEYVEGANLLQMIREPGLAPEQALVIAGQVCTALAYAHGRGVIHRDIKPANVMVDTEGTAKVADFGLARLDGPGAEEYGRTVTGMIMGTEEYMSPEQKRGMAVDHRADIYSVGVMLYEMLCREPPQGAFEPPSERVGCAAQIDQIVIKAMHRMPEGRYQSTTEMKVDLDAAWQQQVSGPPLPAAEPSRDAETACAPAKRAGGWIYALPAVALLAASAIYFLSGPTTKLGTEPSAQAAPAPPSLPSVAPDFFGPAIPPDFKPPAATPVAVADETAMPPTTNAAPEDEPTPRGSPAVEPTPKTAMEIWLDDVDTAQQEAFQKRVAQPFAASLDELRKSYLAALDAGQAKAATTGKLDQALIWNDERKAFADTGAVELDDDSTPAQLRPPRAEFRQKLAQLESVRSSRVKPLLANYDAILQKNIVLLTQRDRIADARLLKNKREEVAKAWLEKPTSKPTVKPFATKDRPFVNSLGMKFVPVPIIGGPTGGQRTLFSVWETRLQD